MIAVLMIAVLKILKDKYKQISIAVIEQLDFVN